jgi:hypothetical protein
LLPAIIYFAEYIYAFCSFWLAGECPSSSFCCPLLLPLARRLPPIWLAAMDQALQPFYYATSLDLGSEITIDEHPFSLKE